MLPVWAQGRGGPRRPTEESRELPDLFRVGDGAGAQAKFGRGRSKKIGVVFFELLERPGLRRAVGQYAGHAVIAVRFEVGDGLLPGRIRSGPAMVINRHL